MTERRPVTEHVILVDGSDEEIGTAEKLAAHQAPGQLHRAISVFLFGTDGRLLLQRRSAQKHHFRRLWGNTTCSHPRPGEDTVGAGVRRLREEMGISADLHEAGTFIYRAEDEASALVEYELDHVLVGVSDEDPRMDPLQADAFDRIDPAELLVRLQADETGFVPWLRLAMEAVPSLLDETLN